jgi:hypothetical protein
MGSAVRLLSPLRRERVIAQRPNSIRIRLHRVRILKLRY